jgi:hypothetical protein
MADTGLKLAAKDELTTRQQEIIAGAAKQLNVPYNNVGSVMLRNGIPETISILGEKGNYNTGLVPLYGNLLNDREKAQLIQDRLSQNEQNLESLNGVSNLLGKNKQPVVSSAGTDRVRAETTANPTFDPSSNRRSNAGLPPGAQNITGSNAQPLVKFASSKGEDTRVRIVVPSGTLQGILLNGPVLYPLSPTNGVLFPYTPSITVQHGAQYNAESLTHSNYAYQFYQSSNTESISITATFACKNSADASYVVAAQHFFRTVTKMFYGQDAEAGVPPPVLRLEGHGEYQFGAHKDQVGGVPIVVTSFSVTLPEDVDYISTSPSELPNNPANVGPGSNPTAIASSNPITRVPIVQQFSITCTPLYSRRSVSQDFGFRKFAAGQLLATSSRGGFI